MLSSIFTVSLAQSAIELGCIYALVALALFVSFSILNIADLSTDGCFTLGCAVCAMVTLQGHPFLGLLAAMGAGVASGFVTAFLQTRLGVESILAGIIVNTGLYTINIAVMGFSSTINLFASKTIFTMAKEAIGGNWYEIIAILIIIVIVAIVLILFLGTRLGLSIRATGDNPFMVRASSISPIFTITVGLCVANAMTGLSGGGISLLHSKRHIRDSGTVIRQHHDNFIWKDVYVDDTTVCMDYHIDFSFIHGNGTATDDICIQVH